MSADVFDFLYERIMHQIKMTINTIKQSTPTTIPAIAHPVRSTKEKQTGMRLSPSIPAYYGDIRSRSDLFL